jgi:hypothetical protein
MFWGAKNFSLSGPSNQHVTGGQRDNDLHSKDQASRAERTFMKITRNFLDGNRSQR